MSFDWGKEGESGLLDNFVFTITRSYFATDEKYQNGEQYLLVWEGTTDSLDVPTWKGWYTPGRGWVSKDGGATIVHESGDPEKYFNKQTQYMKVITRCVEDFGIGDLLMGRGDPFHADTWVGLQFRMKTEPQPKVNNQEVRDKAFPSEFIGVVDGAASSTGATSAAPAKPSFAELKAQRDAAAAAEAARQNGGGAEANGNSGGSLRDLVIATLKEHGDDFEAAQNAAAEIPGVMEDDDLVQELMDPAGLFAKVQSGAV